MKAGIGHVIKRPIVTEKGSALKAEANKIVFEVDLEANKIDVKNAVEKLFDVKVTGVNEDLNQTLERAGRVADFFELGELMCVDALHRRESCGGHFRAESQTEDGEALRDDQNFLYVGAWEFTGTGQQPVLHKEPLEYEYIELKQRSYK